MSEIVEHIDFRRARVSMLTVMFAMGIGVMGAPTRFAEIKVATGASDQQFGIALTVTAVGGLIGTWIAPRIAHWLGTKSLVRWAGVIMILAAGAEGLVTNVWQLTLACGVVGGAYSSMNIGINAQGVDLERHIHRSVVPSLHAAWSVGALCSAIIGNLVASTISPQIHLSAVALIGVALILQATTNLLPPDSHVNLDAPEKLGKLPTAARWPLVILGIGAICALIPDAGNSDWSAIYLREELGAPLGINSLGVTAFLLAQIASRMLNGRLNDRFGIYQVTRVHAVIAFVGYTSAIIAAPRFLPNKTLALAIMLVGIALLGFGVGPMMAAFYSAAGKLPGVPPAQGIARVSLLMNTVMLGFKPLVATVAENVGLQQALLLTSAAIIGTFLATAELKNPN